MQARSRIEVLRVVNVRACARNAKNYSRYSRDEQGLIKLDRYAPSRLIMADEDVMQNDRLVSDNIIALTCISLYRCRTIQDLQRANNDTASIDDSSHR